MRTRFVTRKWPPAVGGMETYSVRLTEALAALHPVETIALPGRSDGAPPTPLALLAFGLSASLRLMLSQPATVTHIGDMAAWPLALAARVRSRKTTIAISAHGTDVSYPLRGGLIPSLYGLYLWAGARLLPGAKVIANSQATAEAAAAYGWTIGATIALATDMKAEPAAEHGRHILFAGRLMPSKGCGWFIRNVLPRLPADITLKVAGTIWDPAEGEALEDERVVFLGPLSSQQLAREYASALCVVVPTREFEGFGLIATEAAAAGGVVLASRHSGLKEALLDGETGFHLPANDSAAWAAKILEIRTWSSTQRREFTETAVEITRRHFCWDRVARETVAAYGRPL